MRQFRVLLFVVLAATASGLHAEGLHLPGLSPVNLGMGGAATAAPVDAIGAVYWNPATMSAMENQVSVSIIDAIPKVRTSSSIAGLGGGSTDSNSGGSLLPGFALTHRRPDSRWTMGLAAATIAGSKVNYPASLTNPIFTPQSNTPGVPGGLGALNSGALYMQFIAAFSYAFSDRLSIGFGPTITASDLVSSPLVVAPVNDADGSGQPRYPTDTGHALHWGGGFELGVYHAGCNGWNFGAAIKSKQWMETAQWNITDELGRPAVAKWHAELPMILTLGTSYTGFENVIVALDVKYIDYTNTRGCGDKGFGPDARVLGMANDSILAVSMGTQLRWTECLYSRFGYTFHERPQEDGDANEAVFGPFFYKHTIHVGGSYRLSESLSLDASYSLVLPASLRGQIVTPAGVVPGSSLDLDLHIHLLAVGATVKY